LGGGAFWTVALAKEALYSPVTITTAVFVCGLLVLALKNTVTSHIQRINTFLGEKLFCVLLIISLGLLSSIISSIIAAILLVEIVSVLRYDREFEIKLVVLGCFSIGLGAGLTPIGEPLSTICIAKLAGAPYHANFFFLLKNLGWYLAPGVIFCGLASLFFRPGINSSGEARLHENSGENFADVIARTAKVYIFIAGLILLGASFKPIIDKYITSLSGAALYWINSVSAVTDNATLAAAEISPRMSLLQIQAALLGLLIAGGMLIPGNIPNIISAGRLGIKSKEWARTAIPFGLALMVIYFVVFSLTKFGCF
jgi:predicted cation transporter